MSVPDLSCLPSSCQTLAGKDLSIVDSKQVFGTRMRGLKKRASTSPLPDIVGSEKKKRNEGRE